jgi:hypothetical protein
MGGIGGILPGDSGAWKLKDVTNTADAGPGGSERVHRFVALRRTCARQVWPMAKWPDDRPPSAEALLAALDECPPAEKWTASHAEAWWANPPQPKTDNTPPPTQVF